MLPAIQSLSRLDQQNINYSHTFHSYYTLFQTLYPTIKKLEALLFVPPMNIENNHQNFISHVSLTEAVLFRERAMHTKHYFKINSLFFKHNPNFISNTNNNTIQSSVWPLLEPLIVLCEVVGVKIEMSNYFENNTNQNNNNKVFNVLEYEWHSGEMNNNNNHNLDSFLDYMNNETENNETLYVCSQIFISNIFYNIPVRQLPFTNNNNNNNNQNKMYRKIRMKEEEHILLSAMHNCYDFIFSTFDFSENETENNTINNNNIRYTFYYNTVPQHRNNNNNNNNEHFDGLRSEIILIHPFRLLSQPHANSNHHKFNTLHAKTKIELLTQEILLQFFPSMFHPSEKNAFPNLFKEVNLHFNKNKNNNNNCIKILFWRDAFLKESIGTFVGPSRRHFIRQKYNNNNMNNNENNNNGLISLESVFVFEKENNNHNIFNVWKCENFTNKKLLLNRIKILFEAEKELKFGVPFLIFMEENNNEIENNKNIENENDNNYMITQNEMILLKEKQNAKLNSQKQKKEETKKNNNKIIRLKFSFKRKREDDNNNNNHSKLIFNYVIHQFSKNGLLESENNNNNNYNYNNASLQQYKALPRRTPVLSVKPLLMNSNHNNMKHENNNIIRFRELLDPEKVTSEHISENNNQKTEFYSFINPISFIKQSYRLPTAVDGDQTDIIKKAKEMMMALHQSNNNHNYNSVNTFQWLNKFILLQQNNSKNEKTDFESHFQFLLSNSNNNNNNPLLLVLDQHAIHERVRLEFFLYFFEYFIIHPEIDFNHNNNHIHQFRFNEEINLFQSMLLSEKNIKNNNNNKSYFLANLIKERKQKMDALFSSFSENNHKNYNYAISFPILIPMDLMEKVQYYKDVLHRLGYRFIYQNSENKSKKVMSICHFPTIIIENIELCLSTVQDLRCLLEEIEMIGHHHHLNFIPSLFLNFLILRSCRGAIMFGDIIKSDLFLKSLLQNLMFSELFYLCSHGRPSMAALERRP